MSQLGGFRAWLSWLISVSFVVVVFALQTGYAITNSYVAQDLSLTIAQIGLLGSIYTWVFAITQLASGSLLDRMGLTVLPVACTFVATGAITFSLGNEFSTLVFAQILMAIGASFAFIGAGFTGGAWFPPVKYGLMFSLVQFVASTSAVLNQQILNFLIVEVDWRTIILNISFIGFFVATLMYIFLRNPEKSADEEISHDDPLLVEVWQNISHVCSHKQVWLNALIGGAAFGTMLGIGVIWGPKLLMSNGLSQSDANIVTSLSWFGLALGSPSWAWISNTVKKRKSVMHIACFLQMLTILTLLMFVDLSYSAYAVLFLLWGFFSGGSMIPFTISSELVKAQYIGTSAAIVNATQFIVGGVMMSIPGQVLDKLASASESENLISDGNVYQDALAAYPLSLLIACVLCFFLRETYKEYS